jgi:hypothetical protein
MSVHSGVGGICQNSIDRNVYWILCEFCLARVSFQSLLSKIRTLYKTTQTLSIC